MAIENHRKGGVGMQQDRDRYLLGMRVNATSYGDVTQRVLAWAGTRESRYVCVATVHMVMEAYDDPIFPHARGFSTSASWD